MYRKLVCLSTLVGLLAGCAGRHAPYDRGYVEEGIRQRSDHTIGPGRDPAASAIPPGVEIEDGVSEDEAVSLALWNNPGFQAVLSDMGIARAGIIEAGMLPNPMFSILFPNPKQEVESSLSIPVEAFWQRAKRLKGAELEAQRVGHLLMQNGLDLIRDVRAAYGELALAEAHAELAAERRALLGRIAELSDKRLEAGDISEFEAMTARVDALRAHANAARLDREIEIQGERVRTLIGFGSSDAALSFDVYRDEPDLEKDLERLLERALEARPDLRASEFAIETAGKKAGLSKTEFFTLAFMLNGDVVESSGSNSTAARDIARNAFRDAGLDTSPAQGTRDAIRDAIREARGKDERVSKSLQLQPGLQFPIPIFNRNQGGIARSEAELERAILDAVAVRDQIMLEVRESLGRYIQANEESELLRDDVLSIMQEAVSLAEKAYGNGAISFLQVLETTRQLQEVRVQEIEAVAASRRSYAELERSVGVRLDLAQSQRSEDMELSE